LPNLKITKILLLNKTCAKLTDNKPTSITITELPERWVRCWNWNEKSNERTSAA